MHDSNLELMNKMVKMIIWIIIVMFLMIGVVLYQSVHGRHLLAKSERKARHGLVRSQRESCERVKKDRLSSITLDMAILRAFKDTDGRITEPITAVRKQSEIDIKNAIEDYKTRALINCTKAFP